MFILLVYVIEYEYFLKKPKTIEAIWRCIIQN